eukprot:11172640-Lingulodinium_polyedra.AAC.1
MPFCTGAGNHSSLDGESPCRVPPAAGDRMSGQLAAANRHAVGDVRSCAPRFRAAGVDAPHLPARGGKRALSALRRKSLYVQI